MSLPWKCIIVHAVNDIARSWLVPSELPFPAQRIRQMRSSLDAQMNRAARVVFLGKEYCDVPFYTIFI